MSLNLFCHVKLGNFFGLRSHIQVNLCLMGRNTSRVIIINSNSHSLFLIQMTDSEYANNLCKILYAISVLTILTFLTNFDDIWGIFRSILHQCLACNKSQVTQNLTLCLIQISSYRVGFIKLLMQLPRRLIDCSLFV